MLDALSTAKMRLVALIALLVFSASSLAGYKPAVDHFGLGIKYYATKIEVCFYHAFNPANSLYPLTETGENCPNGYYFEDPGVGNHCKIKQHNCPTPTWLITAMTYSNIIVYEANTCIYLDSQGVCSVTEPDGETCADNGSATEPYYDCVEDETVCTDYNDCYQWSYTDEGCQLKQDTADLEAALCYEENFDFTDNENFSMSCANTECITGDVDIEEWQDVGDFVLADNGHNSNNDVTDQADPTLGGGDGGSFGTGTGTGSGDTTDDPSNSPRMLIDDSMIINAVDNQTSMINEMLNLNTEEIQDSASSVTDAISDLGSSGVEVGNALGNEIAKTNSLLDSIENEMLSEGRHVYDDNGYMIGVERGGAFMDAFAQTQVAQAFTNITGLINMGNPTCSPFTIDLSASMMGRSFSTNIICDGFATIAPFLSQVMIVLYMFVGFRIFASA